MNPYTPQATQYQDLGGLNPVFQNIAQQQAMQQQAMQQGQGLTEAAAQIGKQGGMNPMMMAAMLRKGKTPDQASINAQDVQMGGLSTYNPFTQFSIAKQYGTDPFSESSRMIAAQNAGFR